MVFCDVLIHRGTIAEGSINKAPLGKMYNRGIRAYKLMYEAFIRKVILHHVEIGEDIYYQVNWRDDLYFKTFWLESCLQEMYNQFLDAREKLKNVEPLQKILDEFSRNCTTFVKHHLFDQVWRLGITARMHQKNSTVCVCFRSCQLCALPFRHAWRHASACK